MTMTDVGMLPRMIHDSEEMSRKGLRVSHSVGFSPVLSLFWFLDYVTYSFLAFPLTSLFLPVSPPITTALVPLYLFYTFYSLGYGGNIYTTQNKNGAFTDAGVQKTIGLFPFSFSHQSVYHATHTHPTIYLPADRKKKRTNTCCTVTKE